MGKLTGAQRKDLDAAIRSRYRGYKSLQMMLTYDLDRDLGAITSAAGMKEVVYDLIEEAIAEGWVEDLVAVVASGQPENPQLAALAAPAGPPTATDAARFDFDLVDLSRFDLTDIEREFRDARRRRRPSRLTATAIACREELFMTSLRQRIGAILGVEARPKIELDGAPWTAELVFKELKKLAPTLKEMAVLCPISVGVDQEVGPLWERVEGAFTALANDLVLLLFIRPGTPLPSDVIMLSAPTHPPADIEIWIEAVGRALGWPPAKRQQVADEIIDELEGGGAELRTFNLYTSLNQLITQLQAEESAARAGSGAA